MSTNGKLNNSQRQALVKVLENAYDRKLQKLREAKESALAQVTREVKSELGITRIDEELEELKHKINELESRKEKLGFSKYNDNAIAGSDAHRMIGEGISSEKERIIQVSSEKDQMIAEIWTATDLSEAKALVDAVLQE
jgi:aspartate oxidase